LKLGPPDLHGRRVQIGLPSRVADVGVGEGGVATRWAVGWGGKQVWSQVVA
jgi:hypothetical protein